MAILPDPDMAASGSAASLLPVEAQEYVPALVSGGVDATYNASCKLSFANRCRTRLERLPADAVWAQKEPRQIGLVVTHSRNMPGEFRRSGNINSNCFDLYVMPPSVQD